MKRFETEPQGLKKYQQYLRALWQGRKHRKLFSEVEAYVMFVGYPRSGHSLVGSLLDAHPDIVIAHELDALHYFDQSYSQEQIFYLILENSRRQGQAGRSMSGYSYVVPNQWQGRHRKLKIIGDKSGGRSSRRLRQAPDQLLQRVQHIASRPLKLVHVIRNPYDNISTMIRRTLKRRNCPLSDKIIQRKIRQYFEKVQLVSRLKAAGALAIHDVYLEDIIADPKPQVAQICRFLEVEPTEDYLHDCASIIWAKPHRTRSEINIWTAENKQQVAQQIALFDFLQRYSFAENE
ncbi:MAG: sulfotransferase [Bacteroidota bacterium]